MTPDKLRWLADALEEALRYADISLAGADAMTKAASYLRACADAVPNVSVPAGSRTSQADWHLAALAAPVAQPLTDEQLRDIFRDVSPGQIPASYTAHWPGLKAFARAVERAVRGEKP
jgi:hypothetical protein